jgi:hypothetical protein
MVTLRAVHVDVTRTTPCLLVYGYTCVITEIDMRPLQTVNMCGYACLTYRRRADIVALETERYENQSGRGSWRDNVHPTVAEFIAANFDSAQLYIRPRLSQKKIAG